ncbi:sugar ABC transporter ATP-binding protein [Fodinicurvata sp. EGI_FJ10296]|uniref:sugar ABC transporter ATP-binding protein n=1 Tax=Fodinicurvata sp. EGI_FJ10296 TaxID=3231908 RepID=UPI003456BD7D
MAGHTIAMQGIVKEFGDVRVLHGVDFDIASGEIHALIGENGAGKSTLMKILSGIEQPTQGRLVVDGETVRLRNTATAESHGIVLIHQEFNLADHLTAEENIFLGRELQWRNTPFIDKRRMRDAAREALLELDCRVDPDTRVRDMPVSDRQMVEIAKAITHDVRFLVMDEPTAVLTPNEARSLFTLMRKLKAQGVGIVYISHKLDEVKSIADRVTVLRDGQHIATQLAESLTQDAMASLMVGRDITQMYPEKPPIADDADIVLSARGISVEGGIHDASFELRRGEILGFAGLIGAGRTELMEGLVGLRRRLGGTIERNGRPVGYSRYADAVNDGIVYLSEDRKGKGLLVRMTMRPNLTLLALDRYCKPFIDFQAEREALSRAVKTYDIRAGSDDMLVASLSGGNQQKLAMAKIMEIDPDIIILDEPTRGIDVGTKRDIYFLIKRLVEAGKACIVVSSELPEIIGLSNRVAVMHAGTITGILEGSDISEDVIVRYATGLEGRNNAKAEDHARVVSA